MSSVAAPVRPRSGATADPTRPGSGRPPRWRLLVVVAAGLAVLGVVGWLVFFSTVLAAKRVEVTGLGTLTAEQVQGAAAVPLGRPMVRQNLDAITLRAQQLPQVEQVQASRRWPNTIVLDVVERRPVLAVAQPEGYQIIDRLGIGYETRPSVPDGVLLAQIDPSNGPLLSQASTVVDSLSPGLRGKVAKISAYSADDLTLTLDSGVTVFWGDASQSALKAQVADAVLKRKPKVAADVSSPHTPAYR